MNRAYDSFRQGSITDEYPFNPCSYELVMENKNVALESWMTFYHKLYFFIKVYLLYYKVGVLSHSIRFR